MIAWMLAIERDREIGRGREKPSRMVMPARSLLARRRNASLCIIRAEMFR